MPDEQLLFGPFKLLPGQRRLLDGDRLVPIGSRALDILVVLAERAGQIVGKDELIAQVWPGIHVEETNLRVQVSAIRKALGEGGHGARYISNIPGRGYSFTAALTKVHEAGNAEPAPPPTVVARSGELPSQLTSIVGREELIRDVASQVPRRRITTLAGPGGVGKTTVAVAVAHAVQEHHPDGVVFVELAPVADAAFLPGRIAAVLGVALDPADPMALLVSALRSKRILLVLDGCEHLIDAVATLAMTLLRQTPDIRLLTTSREPLRVEGEWVTRVPPLAAPAESAPLRAAEALSFPAIQLFVDRAADILGGYELADADAPFVAEICRRLDGIALAIELAAGRVDTFSISELAAQLDDRLRILTRGRRSAVPRHQTLRAALDWSYEGLSPAEQALFRRLSAFRSGFTFKAASVVCANAALPGSAIPDALVDLVAKSLVSAELGLGERSYRLLDTMRAYASEQQSLADDDPDLARRHARYVCTVFGAAATEWDERPSPAWLARHLPLLEDLRAALNWTFGPDGDPALGVALTIASVPLWAQLPLADEFLSWVDRALVASRELPERDRRREMQLHAALGGLQMYGKSRVRQANGAWAAALAIAQELGDVDFQLRAHRALWAERINQGEFRLALSVAETFRELARATSNPEDGLVAERMVGTALHFLGDHARAEESIERMLSRYVAPEGRRHIVRYQFDQRVAARIIRARIYWMRGRADSALREVEETVAEALGLDHTMSLCNVLTQAACPIGLLAGHEAATRRYVGLLRERTAARALDIWNTYATCFEAEAAIHAGDCESGVPRLVGAVAELRSAGFAHYLTWFLSAVAHGMQQLGRTDDALSAIADALGICERTGERWCIAELHRLRGEILCGAPADFDDEANAAFVLALDHAREQGATAWQLRAATSLAALSARRGRPADGLAILQPLHAALGEGRTGPDAARAEKLITKMTAAVA